MDGIFCDIGKLTRSAPIILGKEISSEHLNKHEIAELLTKLSELEKTNALSYYKIKQRFKWINIACITIALFIFYLDTFIGCALGLFAALASTCYMNHVLKRKFLRLFNLLENDQKSINCEFKKCINKLVADSGNDVWNEIDSAGHILNVLKQDNNEEILSELYGDADIVRLKTIANKFIKFETHKEYLTVKLGVDWMVFFHHQWWRKSWWEYWWKKIFRSSIPVNAVEQ